MAARIFIDGEAGTTGLQLRDRLAGRRDFEILSIAPDKRKDPQERKRLLNAADVAILCLPDEAAKESVSLIENDTTKVIDASTAHRIADGWTMALPRWTGINRRRLPVRCGSAIPGAGHRAALRRCGR